MSATNRGAAKAAHDEYLTPSDCVDACLRTLPWGPDLEQANPAWGSGQLCLEPSAGDGRWIERAKALGFGGEWHACELQRKREPALRELATEVHIGRFERYMPRGRRYDRIIGNPPYTLAALFVEHAMFLLNPGGVIGFLLRLNFLGAQTRMEMFERCGPLMLPTLLPRPDFTGQGGDATEYAWIVWRREDYGKLVLADVRPLWWQGDRPELTRAQLERIAALNWCR